MPPLERVTPKPPPGRRPTFLQYVAKRLLGDPVRYGQPGEAYWHCPFHDDTNPSFHTRPIKAGCKDRWSCFSCQTWGDEDDLLRELVGGDYPERCARLDQWRQEYEQGMSAIEGQCGDAVAGISFRGAGGTRKAQPFTFTDPLAVERCYKKLSPEHRRIMTQAADIAMAEGIDLISLAYWCWHSAREAREARERANSREAREMRQWLDATAATAEAMRKGWTPRTPEK